MSRFLLNIFLRFLTPAAFLVLPWFYPLRLRFNVYLALCISVFRQSLKCRVLTVPAVMRDFPVARGTERTNQPRSTYQDTPELHLIVPDLSPPISHQFGFCLSRRPLRGFPNSEEPHLSLNFLWPLPRSMWKHREFLIWFLWFDSSSVSRVFTFQV